MSFIERFLFYCILHSKCPISEVSLYSKHHFKRLHSISSVAYFQLFYKFCKSLPHLFQNEVALARRGLHDGQMLQISLKIGLQKNCQLLVQTGWSHDPPEQGSGPKPVLSGMLATAK